MKPETDEQFRQTVRAWLTANLTGDFAGARGLGGPGREHEAFDVRLAWDRHLAKHGWTCLGWPVEYGGRGATLQQQVIFHEEYARSAAPIRVNHIGEELLGPTLIAFGTPQQRARFLPAIVAVQELWCQGYSEPGAGSDLAAVATRAVLESGPEGDEWVVTGQKVWTSLAHLADWCFVLCRTDRDAPRHRGLSYLLVPMRQPGVEVRPIVQLTGTSEFNEVFFSQARTAADHLVGEPGQGWKVAMATLGFERGVSTLGQQVGFRRELEQLIVRAKQTGAVADPLIRDRITQAWIGLQIMRLNALRMLRSAGTGTAGAEASIAKLFWAQWHRALGELAIDVEGLDGLIAAAAPYELTEAQRLFLFSRADTIYGGSDEVQRTIIAERALGLPREPRAEIR
ncbi:MAG TPA: acyl-CoA dehydrogenase family protein [Kineosporiaceae bacterium]|nr:acyl-CoA dehydrogenase family protein [Kineosporiaceae bacterium]